MKDPVDPTFEFDCDAVGWVAVVATLLCGVVVFGFGRPAWSLPVALVAGSVAAARGGFYDATANNGFVGVSIATVPLAGMFFVYRLGTIPAPGMDPDLLFLTGVAVGADMIGYGPMMVIFGYLGGVAGDRLRRRVRPPIGYRNGRGARKGRHDGRIEH